MNLDFTQIVTSIPYIYKESGSPLKLLALQHLLVLLSEFC